MYYCVYEEGNCNVRNCSEGNEFFKRQNYTEAVKKYTQAIELDGTNHVYYSNRSAAYSGQSLFAEAASDGEKCVSLNPQFVKGRNVQINVA